MQYTTRSRQEAGTWQHVVRMQLAALLNIEDLLKDKKKIPLNPREITTVRKRTYTIKEIEINSTQKRRIRLLLTLPLKSDEQLPAVVCLGGHGSTMYSPYDVTTIPKDAAQSRRDRIYKGFGTKLTERGYVTIATTVSQHQVYEPDRTLMGERLWDCMRCVDYLETLPQVDPARIGCAGLSLGGEMTMWLGAMDERISAVVSAGFLTEMDQMEQNHCLCWKFDGLRALVDFSDIYALTAPRALQCQNGLKEPQSQFYVPLARKAMEEIRLIYRDMERPEQVILDVHAGGHEIDLPGLIYFFEKHLYGNRWIGLEDKAGITELQKITFDLNKLDENGLYGPADGL